jgi:hypothetical protein
VFFWQGPQIFGSSVDDGALCYLLHDVFVRVLIVGDGIDEVEGWLVQKLGE